MNEALCDEELNALCQVARQIVSPFRSLSIDLVSRPHWSGRHVSQVVTLLQTSMSIHRATRQKSARKQMASHKHTLKLNEGFLEKCLVDVMQTVLSSPGLQMQPDCSSTGSEAGRIAIIPSLPLHACCMPHIVVSYMTCCSRFFQSQLPLLVLFPEIAMSSPGFVELSDLSPEELAIHLARRHEKRKAALAAMKEKPMYQICQLMKNNNALRPDTSPPRTPRDFENFSKRRWEGACRRFRTRMKEWESHYRMKEQENTVNNSCNLS